VTVFTAVLVFALGLVAWAASERYYEENLAPAASIEGRVIPKRDFLEQRDYELVRFYQDFGVPPGFENDPQLLSQKAAYDDADAAGDLGLSCGGTVEIVVEPLALQPEARAELRRRGHVQPDRARNVGAPRPAQTTPVPGLPHPAPPRSPRALPD